MTTFAVIKDNIVENIVVLNQVSDWHTKEDLLVEVSDPILGTQIPGVGWTYKNNEFIEPAFTLLDTAHTHSINTISNQFIEPVFTSVDISTINTPTNELDSISYVQLKAKIQDILLELQQGTV